MVVVVCAVDPECQRCVFIARRASVDILDYSGETFHPDGLDGPRLRGVALVSNQIVTVKKSAHTV